MDEATSAGGGWLGWAVLLAVLGLWMLGAHNRLTALRGKILGAWAPLEAALTARNQALAGVLAAAEGPLATERAALDSVSAALAQAVSALEPARRRPTAQPAVAEVAKSDAVLGAVNQRLLALVEQHAELGMDAGVRAHLGTLAEQRQRIAFAREAFNQAVGRYNAALGEFPTRLLVSVLRFEPAGMA